jgi:hypothetical protein
MGTWSPAILDRGALFWMFRCYFAAPGGLACSRWCRDRNRATEECLPNGEYSSGSGAASHPFYTVRPAIA